MQTKTLRVNNIDMVIVQSEEILIFDVQSTLDLIATIWYETGCNRVVLKKCNVCEDFFRLSTKLAGEILQKFINYNFKLAIIGDFSIYDSKSLKDFIYESNNGRDIFFLKDENEAIEKFSKV